jgi:hypothetical protein
MPYVCFMKTGVLTGVAVGKAIPETRFDFKWHVGGAITVDATWLVVHSPPSSFPSADDASIEMSNWSLYLDRIGKPHDPRSLSSTHSDTAHQASVEADAEGEGEGEKEAEQGSSTAAATLPSTVSGVMSGYGRHVGEHLSPRYFEASFKVSLAQSSDSSTKKAPSTNTHVHAYSTSASISNRNSTSTSALLDEKKSLKTHPPATPQKSRTVHLAPGVYWVVAWCEVDSTWGKEKQGHGADTPQSYLSNARTNPEWLSSQSVHKNAPGNLRTSEVKSEVRMEYDTVKSREVRGRKLWPSDPVIIEVMADGQVLLQSTVLECAWWRRGLSESEAYRSSIHAPKSSSSSSSSKQTGAGAGAGASSVAADGSHKEDSGSDNGGSKSSDESTDTPAEFAEPNSSSKDKDTAAETGGVENDDNLNTTYGFTVESFRFESGRGYMILVGLLFVCIAVYIVRRLMSTSAAQSRARRIPAQFQRIPIAQA